VSDDIELTPKDRWWNSIFEDLRAQEAEAARRAAHPPPRLVAESPTIGPATSQAQAKISAKVAFDQRFRVIQGPSDARGDT
jgi:hypothetical protein